MAAYSPKDGEVFDQRLWGVRPTHHDQVTGRDHVFSHGSWWWVTNDNVSRRWVGLCIDNQKEVIARLKKK